MQAASQDLRQSWRFANAINSIPPETMTGKVLDNGASGALILLLPIALTMVVLFTAWPAVLLLIAIGMGWRLWQHYQWKQWCQQVDPFFHQLIQEHRGYLTPMDLSLKTKLTGRAARQYLDKKAEEYGAQCKEEDKGRVYYFLTAGALGSIFDDSEPFSELDEELESESHLASASSAVEVPASVATPTEKSASVSLDSGEQTESETSTPSATKSVASSVSTTVSPDSADSEVEHESPQPEARRSPPASPQEAIADQDSQTESDTANGKPPPEAETPLSDFLESASEDQPSSASDSDLALIQAELAKRLDLHSSTVGKRKSDPDFSEWSQSRDPEGIAWQYVPETKMFMPIEEAE